MGTAETVPPGRLATVCRPRSSSESIEVADRVSAGVDLHDLEGRRARREAGVELRVDRGETVAPASDRRRDLERVVADPADDRGRREVAGQAQLDDLIVQVPDGPQA